MKPFKLLTAVFALCSLTMFGQGAKNIKINEVMTNNTASVVDEYGNHHAWIELANTSFSTINLRGMYIATDTAVLNKKMPAPDRIAMMSIIPSNEPRTNLSARQHLLLYLNSNPASGSLHISAKCDPTAPLWIGIYEGNGVDLVDSVTVPVLAANTSYAREKDGSDTWVVASADLVTPNIGNLVQVSESKLAQIKRDDPHGFAITLLSMGIVFSCLALLFIFFSIFGKYMKAKQDTKHSQMKARHLSIISAQNDDDEDERAFPKMKVRQQNTKGDDPDVYAAVISLALKEYLDNTHDIESDIITIIPKHSNWTRV